MIIDSFLSGSIEPSTQYQDYAFPDAGKFESIDCGICGTKMNVKRNVFGPTSFGAAMAKKGRQHDAFSCPHRDEPWHIQAKKLRDEIGKTPSRRIAEIIHAEFCHVIREREPTKKVSKF